MTDYSERFEKRQRKEQFFSRQTEAFRQGYTDCRLTRSLAKFDMINNEYDHQFNPYVTRSPEWDEYRAGCRRYYDEQ